jgi:hypothetical protein
MRKWLDMLREEKCSCESLNHQQRRLIPIASAWFDQTTEVIRVDDADVKSASASDVEEFGRMRPLEVSAFECRVLASCCPEVLRGTGLPAYETASQFRYPDRLKSLSTAAETHPPPACGAQD